MFCDKPETKREKRRAAILAAAEQLFLEKGYEATTLGDIVRQSGGSLATLYEMFENKPGLLRALVGERCQEIGASFDRAISAHQPPEIALREIAELMFDRILDRSAVGLLRVAIAQDCGDSDLGRQLYEAGPARGHAKAAEYFEAQRREGALKIDDPVAAGQIFAQLVLGHFHNQLIFGVPVSVTAAEKAQHLDHAVGAFLKIYA
jgi:AcrR family transcriptional regulator